MRNRSGALVFGVLLALTVILIDQLSKLWVFNNFVPGESVLPLAFWPTIRDGSAGSLASLR